ncbi:hypothetical protein FOG51_01951 [Hanseniaspora uvarum]|nr:hypothetical protein FOG51_01951 [Hanseniaspora uvarum]
MSFQFNFDDSDLEIESGTLNNTSQPSYSLSSTALTLNNLSANKPNDLIPTGEITVECLLKTLLNVRLTYSKFPISSTSFIVRRELYDIRHQIMSESDPTTTEEIVNLDFLDKDDLLRNVYEGGLTTWECSIDLVKYLDSLNGEIDNNKDIIELGCGTALPSLYLFNQVYLKNSTNTYNFVLSDYNEYVLRLVTLPNILINWYDMLSLNPEFKQILDNTQEIKDTITENEFTITQELIDLFLNDIKSKNINIGFIKGTWSNELIHIINKDLNANERIILTSETIYQPDTMPLLTDTLVQLKRSDNDRIVLATKDIYFGVGGNLIDFLNYLKAFYSDQYKYEVIKSGTSNRSLVIL